jgi:hypothetical protein
MALPAIAAAPRHPCGQGRPPVSTPTSRWCPARRSAACRRTARHVQVLRMQPGEALTAVQRPGRRPARQRRGIRATVERMGRSDVEVMVGAYTATAREAGRAVHLAVGMPANERMDWLIEKAAELGVASIQPLMSERSVLRLKGERADKKAGALARRRHRRLRAVRPQPRAAVHDGRQPGRLAQGRRACAAGRRPAAAVAARRQPAAGAGRARPEREG